MDKKLTQKEQLFLNELKKKLSQLDDFPMSVHTDELLGLIAKGAIKSNISHGWKQVRITRVNQTDITLDEPMDITLDEI